MSGRAEIVKNRIEKVIQKSGDAIEDGIRKASKSKRKLMEEVNREAAFWRAVQLGLRPIEKPEVLVREYLNQQIIEEIKKRKLTHAEVADICLTSRPRITKIMNKKLKKISTDHLINILGVLGIQFIPGNR